MKLHNNAEIFERRNYCKINIKIVSSKVYNENIKIVSILQQNFLVESTVYLNRTPGFRETSFGNIVLDKYFG
jgi:hypothetical protein